MKLLTWRWNWRKLFVASKNNVVGIYSRDGMMIYVVKEIGLTLGMDGVE